MPDSNNSPVWLSQRLETARAAWLALDHDEQHEFLDWIMDEGRNKAFPPGDRINEKDQPDDFAADWTAPRRQVIRIDDFAADWTARQGTTADQG